MGSSSTRERKKFEISNDDELQFYTDVEDPILGPVKIYTSKKFHLCYILKYEIDQDDTKIYNIFKKVQINQLNPLLSLHGFNVSRRSCCSRVCVQKITSYWQYYNFYFNEYIAKRCNQGLTFVDLEIWHIIEVCCETYNIFRKFGIYYQINPETFVITPQGKLKAFWCHLKSQNHHLKYFQYFDKQYKIYRFAYSPQQLQFFHEKERTTKIDFDKCNSFRLGILLLHCLSLVDPLSHCYNPSMTAINPSCIKCLIIHKVAPNYSNQIVHLLKALLRQDPQQRPTLAEIYEEHFNKFSPDFELRVCGIRATDSLHNINNIHEGEELPELQILKKASDFSDAKTVKYRHSIKKN